MIKSMIKRAWLSITRKPSKTVILTIVLFVMANLVLASIAIKNAVNESTHFAKASLGSTVYLAPDMEKVRESARQNASGGTSDQPMRMRIERPEIKLEKVLILADSIFVKDFTYGIMANAKEGNITPIENNMSAGNGPSFSFNNRSINAFGNISIVGINAYAFINEVQNKSLSLINGTYFDEKTDNQVIISNELAELNNLKVGSKIKLINEEIDLENYDPRFDESPNVKNSKPYELTIIGIYDIATDNFNGNTIYMNVKTAALFLKVDRYNNGNYGVENVTFFLNSPEDAEDFIAEANIKYPTMPEDKLTLSINNDAYEQMAGPIEQVGSFADSVLWLVIIAAIVIITLIINGNIKDRKYEMGVLMSLGGSKKNIFGSILLELIIIGTVGFILSFGTSYFLANYMGKNLLASQLKLVEEQNQNNYGRPGMMVGGGTVVSNIRQTNAKPIDSIKINIETKDYLQLFLVGYSISIVAMLVPAINVLKYEPKTILTGRL